MTIYHDSRVRTDWLAAGMGRTSAKKLADAARPLLRESGAISSYAHTGRRGPTDFLAETTPGGWGDNHAGSSTVKVRGCDAFRREALAVLRSKLIESGQADRLVHPPDPFVYQGTTAADVAQRVRIDEPVPSDGIDHLPQRWR